MRIKFHEQLNSLNNELLEMAALVEKSIENAVKALKNQDVELARTTLIGDDEVDQKEKEIESLCLKLLLQQQPVARDLRQISAALKMITDMERIGDQAADISEITIAIAGQPFIKKLEDIPLMAEATIKMVNDCVDAFVKKDVNLANEVIKYDDVVDELFTRVKNHLFELILENRENGGQALDLLMIAKYFERIGDDAVNIAEWVLFSITGEHKRQRIV